MLKLTVYIPDFALEDVKSALFDAGAGAYDNYDRCCWVVRGEGQFRPLKGSDPAIGKVGKSERVVEYKLEILVPDNLVIEVEKAIKRAHPYEVPAYDFVKLHQPEP
ncbi:NGG1p interacting factor NIF3 [Allohahella marinimesophila]|uniref:YqfO family protein n=1 Tax=Allohahella marinimesophila TaxID=1054972 RepID=A0ABP7NR60_9GAMM